MMNPLISVIVPCYNQAIYLPETLQSVLDQDYPHWECIIVNDGSPDNTEDVAREWTEKDSRFKYFWKENSGVCDTRNFGIKQATGEYILPLDGDDKIGPHYFREAVAAFTKEPDIKLIYSDIILFGDINGKKTCPDFSFERMLTENQISNSAIFKRADYIETGGYNPNMIYGIEDWDFYLSLIKPSDKVVKLNEFHLYYRIKSISRSNIDRQTEKNDAMLLQMFRNHVPLFLKYFNPVRDRIEAETYKKELNWHYNTIEYKLGRAIFTPYRLLKMVYHRLLSK